MAKKEGKKIKGFSGGSIALIIYLFILAFFFIFTTISMVILLISEITPPFILAFLTSLIASFLLIYSIILAFQKSKKFRILASITFLVVIAGFIIGNGIRAVFSWGVILSVVCIVYLSLSKRIKDTFSK